VVLSVGWIAKTLKRMDYTVNEIASMPHPRPYLVLLGAIDDQSPPIFKLAEEKLGAGNFAIRSVPPDEVNRYYESADVFVLSSLQEGFGRVYIEALISGLPVIAHDGPVTRFVLGDEGDFADLSLPGGLSAALIRRLQKPSGPTDTAARRESVRERFSWEKLAPAYAEMFRAAERG
jgi:glycosyltransferase involved in cell wall biosynthesis